MIWQAAAMVVVGLFLSAFFSGSETGFYRATRLRLLLDAMAGDRVARGLHWLTNHPALFVATTLVGNNTANYLTSAAIVIGTQSLITGHGHAEELIAPLLLAPILFVYGELLPKNLFLHAPNRLLRRVGPLFLCFVGLLFPVSAVLWGLNNLIERLMGHSPEQVRLTLARRELHGVLEEGHEAGLLHPAQRGLAQGIFAVANRPIIEFTTPLEELPRARSNMTRSEVLQVAGRYRLPVVPVESPKTPGKLIGYYRVIDLGLSRSEETGPLRRLLTLPTHTSHVAALTQMQSEGETLARVIDDQGVTVGIVSADRLREPLFRAVR